MTYVDIDIEYSGSRGDVIKENPYNLCNEGKVYSVKDCEVAENGNDLWDWGISSNYLEDASIMPDDLLSEVSDVKLRGVFESERVLYTYRKTRTKIVAYRLERIDNDTT